MPISQAERAAVRTTWTPGAVSARPVLSRWQIGWEFPASTIRRPASGSGRRCGVLILVLGQPSKCSQRDPHQIRREMSMAETSVIPPTTLAATSRRTGRVL